MCHHCKKNHGCSPRSFYKSIVYNSRFCWSRGGNSQGKEVRKVHMMERKRALIGLGMRGREENSKEGMKLDMEKVGR